MQPERIALPKQSRRPGIYRRHPLAPFCELAIVHPYGWAGGHKKRERRSLTTVSGNTNPHTTPARTGHAMLFHGHLVSQLYEYGSESVLDSDQPWTICAQVMRTGSDAFASISVIPIDGFAASANPTFVMGSSATWFGSMVNNTGDWANFRPNQTPVLNRWHDIHIVHDGNGVSNISNFRYYLDGARMSLISASNWAPGTETGRLRVGGTNYTDNFQMLGGINYLVFLRGFAATETAINRWLRAPQIYALGLEMPPFFDHIISIPSGAVPSVTPADVLHAHTISEPTLAPIASLTVDPVLHLHTISEPAITALAQLAIDNTLHTHPVSEPTLTAQTPVTPDATLHAHPVGTVTLTAHAIVTVDDTLHAHPVSEVTLSVEGALVVDNVDHAHTIDTIVITARASLSVDSALHAHTISEPQVGTILAVANAVHDHFIAESTLIARVTIIVDNALHAHLISSPSVGVVVETPEGLVIVVEADDDAIVVMADTIEIEWQ